MIRVVVYFVPGDGNACSSCGEGMARVSTILAYNGHC